MVAGFACRISGFLPPIPPTPFPGGEGGDQSYFMQGASPLASPGWAGRGTGEGGEPRARRGRAPYRAGLGGHPGAQRGACPVGCLPSLTIAFFFAPIPLPPSPAGKGEILGYFMQGASPLASPGLNLYGAGSTLGKQFLSVMPKTFPFNNIIEKSP